jgi:hypothetical protein
MPRRNFAPRVKGHHNISNNDDGSSKTFTDLNEWSSKATTTKDTTNNEPSAPDMSVLLISSDPLLNWADEMDQEDARSWTSDSDSAGHSDTGSRDTPTPTGYSTPISTPAVHSTPPSPLLKPVSPASTPSTPDRRESDCGSCTAAVMKVIREHLGKGEEAHDCGWVALQSIWSVSRSSLDSAVLGCLSRLHPRQQEHILLSFSSIDLSRVKNLSAYLNRLIKEHETTPQVCLYFLAGNCEGSLDDGCECPFVHPINTSGWHALWTSWEITHNDFDYTVLNFLCKLRPEVQDYLLSELAAMDIRSINNLSAFLSAMIQKAAASDPSTPMPLGMSPSMTKRRPKERTPRREPVPFSFHPMAPPMSHPAPLPHPYWCTFPPHPWDGMPPVHSQWHMRPFP